MKKAILNWSTGKDAAYALYKVQLEKKYDVSRLVTTVNENIGRVSMHGIRKEVLFRQVEALGLESDVIYLDENINMADYEFQIKRYWQSPENAEVESSIFGDILLEDLKVHRENQLATVGVKAVFPLWNIKTSVLINEMIEAGFKAMVICVNERYLDKSFIGRTIDKQFVADLPSNVDPCGEHGEFHTFVYDGPNFKHPVSFELGEVVHKNYEVSVKTTDGVEVEKYGYWFLDLL